MSDSPSLPETRQFPTTPRGSAGCGGAYGEMASCRTLWVIIGTLDWSPRNVLSKSLLVKHPFWSSLTIITNGFYISIVNQYELQLWTTIIIPSMEVVQFLSFQPVMNKWMKSYVKSWIAALGQSCKSTNATGLTLHFPMPSASGRKSLCDLAQWGVMWQICGAFSTAYHEN